MKENKKCLGADALPGDRSHSGQVSRPRAAVTAPADAGAGRAADEQRSSRPAASVRVRGPQGRGLNPSGRGLETSVSLCYLIWIQSSAYVEELPRCDSADLPPDARTTPLTASSRLPTLPPEDLRTKGRTASLRRSWALQP